MWSGLCLESYYRCLWAWQILWNWKAVNGWFLLDNLIVTHDDIADTTKNAPTNCSNGIDYELFLVVLLAIACLH